MSTNQTIEAKVKELEESVLVNRGEGLIENTIREAILWGISVGRENAIKDFESFLYDNLGTDQKSGEIAFAFKDFRISALSQDKE